jgi:hypothetical protein
MNKEKLGLMLAESLELKYKAERADALARFAVYMNNPVAIGEHPQHTEEMDKLVTQFTDANDKLSALKEMVDAIK